ncbi:MAG: nicotinate-nucleotide adenylyltransferase [Bacteroidia bacterium]|nr:nicotinate-nucleotide adenylyltransferase [Bacteroidia bacterium]
MPPKLYENFLLDSDLAEVKKVGLYFGSFNPIHNGHLSLARFILENTNLQKLWFVVSPQNPFKPQSILADDMMRFEMVRIAIEDEIDMDVSDVEFSLPKPSYTIDTLNYLSQENQHIEFSLLIGADNVENFCKWKDYQKILSEYDVLVYPRNGYDLSETNNKYPEMRCLEAPLFDLSSSYVRNLLREGKNVSDLLKPEVLKYIKSNNIYNN